MSSKLYIFATFVYCDVNSLSNRAFAIRIILIHWGLIPWRGLEVISSIGRMYIPLYAPEKNREKPKKHAVDRNNTGRWRVFYYSGT